MPLYHRPTFCRQATHVFNGTSNSRLYALGVFKQNVLAFALIVEKSYPSGLILTCTGPHSFEKDGTSNWVYNC